MKPDYRLSARIRIVMERNNLSSYMIAKEADVSVGTVENYVNERPAKQWHDEKARRVREVVKQYEKKAYNQKYYTQRKNQEAIGMIGKVKHSFSRFFS